MKICIAGALCVFAGMSPFAHAQRASALELSTQRAALTPRSTEWWRCGIEQAVVELEFDLPAALASVEHLLATGGDSNPAGAAAARAIAEYARVSLEGPGATPELKVASAAPPNADSALVAHEHIARSRTAWLRDHPSRHLVHALAAVRAARECDDMRVLLLALWNLHGVTESEATWYDDRIRAEIERLSRGPGGERFEPWRQLDRYWRDYSVHSHDERARWLQRIQSAAASLGDLRTACLAEWELAALASEVKDAEGARAALSRALAHADSAGWLRERALCFELMAQTELALGRLEAAEAALARAFEISGGRGQLDRDTDQAHLRLRLATERGDQEAMLAAHAELKELRRAEEQRYANYNSVREPLFAAERERLEIEQRSAAAQASFERQAESFRTWGLAVAVAALSVGVVLALRSSRRLASAKQRLEGEARRAEEQTRAREAAETRLRRLEHSESLGLIASGVAHDFNNLMVGVLGNAELLRLDERDPERARRLDVITASGERAARLCAQLQSYAGSEPVTPTPIGVSELLAQFQPVLAAATGAGVEIAIAPPDSGLELHGDRSQIEQALLNLVLNARDAHARVVTVRAELLEPRLAPLAGGVQRGDFSAERYVVLEVRDNGEGMPRTLLERVFDPFFTTRFPGRGLGLAVVMGVLRRHGGVVWVDSEVGRGTRFRLCFPVATGAARDVLTPKPRASRATVAAASASMHVLAIDDEEQVRNYLRTALRSRGHQVTLARDLDSALAALEAFPASGRALALLDVTLATCDGRDVLLALRARRPQLRCVLMSGHAATQLESLAESLDAQGWIAKPFGSEQLEQALELAFEGPGPRVPAAAPER